MPTPTKSFVLYTNKISSGSELTASEEAVGYEDDNLYDNDQELTWRSEDDTGEKTILWNAGSEKKVTAIGIANHNYSSSGTFTLKCGSTSDVTDNTWNLTMTDKIDPYKACFFSYLDGSEYTKQYWKFGATEDTSDDYHEAGVLYLGEYIELPRKPSAVGVRYSDDHKIEEIRHAGGQKTIYDLYSIRGYSMEWKALTLTEFNYFEAIWKANKKSVPFFFCLHPDKLEDSLYAITVEFVFEERDNNKFDLKWVVEEAL